MCENHKTELNCSNCLSSADDPTSIGCLLIKMGAVSVNDVVIAMSKQTELSPNIPLGSLLVDLGMCTEDQVKIALLAQKGMRSDDRSDIAIGLASLATEKRRIISGKMVSVLSRVKSVTTDDHPAVTDEMLKNRKTK